MRSEKLRRSVLLIEISVCRCYNISYWTMGAAVCAEDATDKTGAAAKSLCGFFLEFAS